MVLILIFISSCEWKPNEIEVIQISTSRTINLAIEDTITLNIFGTDFSEIAGQNSVVAEVIEALQVDSGNMITIVGTGVGSINLSFTYKAPRESTMEAASAMYVIRLNVSESIPLFINVGESQILDLSNYLSNEQMDALDSIAMISGDFSPFDRIRIEPVVGENTEFILTGEYPGPTALQINCYDANGSLMVSLYYEISVSIHKVVLAELFTNTGCVNCPEANHYLDNIAAEYSNEFTLVRYHVNWTDLFDPMNLYNPGEVENRRAYYNIIAAPGFVLEGTLINSLDEDDWSGRVFNASQEVAPIYIGPVDVLETVDSLHLEFELNSFTLSLSDLTVWSLVLEDSIEYAGPNGEDLHMDVMRDMTSISLGGINGFKMIQHSLKKPDNYGTAGPMNLMVFIQADSDKSVLQSRKQNLY